MTTLGCINDSCLRVDSTLGFIIVIIGISLAGWLMTRD